MKPMITNGGPHPADKWADMTTDTILELIEVPEDADTPEAAQARQVKRDLRVILFNTFNETHAKLQGDHRKSLKKLKTCQKSQSIDVSEHLGPADVALGILSETPFAAHFAQPHVQEVIRQIVARDTANIIHIERCHHSDGLAAKGA